VELATIYSALAGAALGAAVVAAAARWRIRRSLERVRAAERRARGAERLAEIGGMTGGLAHEIKNPLSTIGLNAQLLAEGIDELPQDRPAEPEMRQRLLRRVGSLRREVERLRGILTDFLTYAGELRLDPAPTDLNQLVDELTDFFLPQAQRHGVRLRTQPGKESFSLPLDAPLIKQALLNLMLNAVQAMSAANGDARAGSPRELILRTEHYKDRSGETGVRLHVIDTGPGIPADVLPRLFTPYFTTKAGGTGLGLPTTRRIIEAHQGRIEVVTQPGQGTDFVISFPAP
jgi:signal transduction histidine kinase